MAYLHMVVMALKYRNKEWLQEQYIEKEKTSYELAELCDVTSNTIRNWLHKHDIPVRDGGAVKGESQDTYPKLRDEDWLREKYIEDKMSTKQIAKTVGCVDRSVRMAIKRNDIEMRTQEEAAREQCGHAMVDKRLLDKEWLENQYEEKSIAEIARKVGVTWPAVRYRMNEHGIDTGENEHHFTNADTEFQSDPNWDERRKVAIERDNNHCQDCSVSGEEFDRALDVHHLEKKEDFVEDGEMNWSQANAPDNLVTLCRSCHIKRHANGHL